MHRIACFTGHRSLPSEELPRLKSALREELERQIECGTTVFRAGGALGFDTLAALSVLSLQQQHPHIRLELILPCPAQTRGWSQQDRKLYEQIRMQADAERYLSQQYFQGLLQLRNQALVKNADVCIAYLCHSNGGGTAYTAALAIRQGLEFVNLRDRL